MELIVNARWKQQSNQMKEYNALLSTKKKRKKREQGDEDHINISKGTYNSVNKAQMWKKKK